MLILLTAVFAILLISGVFNLRNKEAKTLFENELNHIENDIYTHFGSISSKSVDLAKTLNISIEKILKEKKILIGDLKNYPDVFNELLDAECQTLVTALLRTKSSGVFMILDGTINPNLPCADFSKTGIYIRNMEPNIVNLESPYLHMLRGPTDIAKNNNIPIHPQWEMEFDINEVASFTKTIYSARNNTELPISKLYYWHHNTGLSNTADDVMLCNVPLIASDGTIYGVCGFEVSSLLFKLSYIPDLTISDAVFALLTKPENKEFDLSSSFLSAKYPAFITNELTDTRLFYQINQNSLIRYYSASDEFIGLHKNISLYADGSPYENEEWAVSVMVPAKDYERTLASFNHMIVMLLFVLLFIAIAASFWSSKFYLKPITETISKMKQTKPSEIEKTNIIEIDDLLEFLSQQDIDTETKAQIKSNTVTEVENIGMFKEFLKNIETLSPAERTVFDLYMEGYTGKEIAEKLYLSINTIKTHNKRIYDKMNVSSRNELMLYFRMMKEINVIRETD